MEQNGFEKYRLLQGHFSRAFCVNDCRIENRQRRIGLLENNRVSVQPGHGFYAKIDLGIVKYQFEIGAGKEHFQWV